MKCQHCKLGTLGKVLETRAYGGVIYRRRYCGNCGNGSVTVEDCQPSMKIPGGAYRRDRSRHRAEPDNQGRDLAGVWK